MPPSVFTPEEFGQPFRVSESGAAQVSAWLPAHGMEVEEVTAGRCSIFFSGTAVQVAEAFPTQTRVYNVGNEVHHANASDPEIPAAFAGMEGGVVSPHDFRSEPMHTGIRKPAPAFTSGGSCHLALAELRHHL